MIGIVEHKRRRLVNRRRPRTGRRIGLCARVHGKGGKAGGTIGHWCFLFRLLTTSLRVRLWHADWGMLMAARFGVKVRSALTACLEWPVGFYGTGARILSPGVRADRFCFSRRGRMHRSFRDRRVCYRAKGACLAWASVRAWSSM